MPTGLDEGTNAEVPASAKDSMRPRGLLRRFGAGLITGAADDDPSGIATYSQAGARFGYATLWSALLTLPLMIAMQMICAQVGRVTGRGLAANMRQLDPKPWLFGMVGLLLLANIVNLAADVGAMGEALHLLIGGPAPLYALGFAMLSLLLEVFVPFPRYSPLLKALTVSLFAYVLTALVVEVPWRGLITQLLPQRIGRGYLLTVVAIFGTTISPYLFFWQASEEAEEEEGSVTAAPLVRAPEQAAAAFRRIGLPCAS